MPPVRCCRKRSEGGKRIGTMHLTKHHLFRYCDEFSFRWNHRKVSDGERTTQAIKGIEGKRLNYK
jgi:hypothetical protein